MNIFPIEDRERRAKAVEIAAARGRRISALAPGAPVDYETRRVSKPDAGNLILAAPTLPQRFVVGFVLLINGSWMPAGSARSDDGHW